MAFLPQRPPLHTKPERVRVPVFAIGRRVLACRAGRSGNVTLTDGTGAAIDSTLRNDTEVAIVAWRPSGEATQYLVRAVDSGVEGWLGVGQIRGKPVPAVPPRAPIPAPAVTARVPLPMKPRRAAPAKARNSR